MPKNEREPKKLIPASDRHRILPEPKTSNHMEHGGHTSTDELSARPRSPQPRSSSRTNPRGQPGSNLSGKKQTSSNARKPVVGLGRKVASHTDVGGSDFNKRTVCVTEELPEAVRAATAGASSLRSNSADSAVFVGTGAVEKSHCPMRNEMEPVKAERIAPAGAVSVGRSPQDEYLSQIEADPISAMYEFANQGGYWPQQHQLVSLIIAGVSAAATTPVTIQLAGEFSDGKSTVAQLAQQILGPDFVATSSSVQKMSAAALCRMGSNLTGHAIFLDERCRGDGQFEAMLRQAASGQRSSRVIVVKGEPIELTVDPPVAIVDLALADMPMSQQDRSRMLRIRMPSDEASRNHVTSLNLQRYTIQGIQRKVVLSEFCRAFQAVLAGLSRSLRVVVPFAEEIRMETKSRLRDRIINNLLNAVCTVAWLRQHHRIHRHDPDIGEYIVADASDYQIVYQIVLACAEDGSDGELPDNALRLFRLWSDWCRSNGNQGLLRSQLEELAAGGLGNWQVYRALRDLDKAGYASGGLMGRGLISHWRLTDLGLASNHPNLFGLLPKPEEIAAMAQDFKSAGTHELTDRPTEISSLAEGAVHESL
mgnify:CR=1 FL=1